MADKQAKWTVSHFTLSVSMLLTMCITNSVLGGTIKLHPGPSEKYRSKRFQVQVEKGEKAFVFGRENGWYQHSAKNRKSWAWWLENMSAENNWVSMSAEGTVHLNIRAVGIKVNNAELLPVRPGNAISVSPDGTVKVTLKLNRKQADYYFIRINKEYGNKYPLFIFADPPMAEPSPTPKPGVHIFGPGVHNIGPHYPLKSGETVYLAPGSLVLGTFLAKGTDITIRGRGVLSGESWQKEWMLYNRGLAPHPRTGKVTDGRVQMIRNDSTDKGKMTIEGITIIDTPGYIFDLKNAVPLYKNLKMMSWNFSTDGVAGAKGVVEHCFFKLNDDVFTVYRNNLTARNLVIWKQLNGAIFQLGYGYEFTVTNCLIERVDVIRDETNFQTGQNGIIALSSSKGTAFRNMVFQDIKVYGDTLNLLAIDNLNIDNAWSLKKKNVTLREIDLKLNRVTVTGTERGQWWMPKEFRGKPMRSRLRTADTGSIQILFNKVSINGKKVRSASDFPNGLATKGNVKLKFK